MSTTSNLSDALPTSQEWKEILEDILPGQGVWTEEQYLVLTDHTNRLVEFTDGFLEVLPMPRIVIRPFSNFCFWLFSTSSSPGGEGAVRGAATTHPAGQVS